MIEMEHPEQFEKEQLTINLTQGNLIGLFIILPIGLIFGLPFYLLWKDRLNISAIKTLTEEFMLDFTGSGFLLLILFILGIIAHELIHGITWSRFASKGFKSIKFGVLWKMLTPYCHCKEPLKVKYYIIGALMPAIILGIIPSLISIITGNTLLLLAGIFFTVVAVGDFMIVQLLYKEDMNDYVQDHPSEAGCFIYRKKPNSPLKKMH